MKIKKQEFSKLIVKWAMSITTVFLIATTIGFYKTNTIPIELVNMVSLIVSSIIVTYSGKAGFENYQKIKNNGITCDNQNQDGGNING